VETMTLAQAMERLIQESDCLQLRFTVSPCSMSVPQLRFEAKIKLSEWQREPSTTYREMLLSAFEQLIKQMDAFEVLDRG